MNCCGKKEHSDNSYYIQVDVENKRNIQEYTNDELIDLIKDNDLSGNTTKYYYVDEPPNIGKNTKRVNYIHFKKLN